MGQHFAVEDKEKMPIRSVLLNNRRCRHSTQRSQVVALHAHSGGKLLAFGFGGATAAGRINRHSRERTAAVSRLGNSAMKQAAGLWRHHQGVHGQTTRGLAEDRHIVRVTAKSGDIARQPLQRGYLVHEAVVGQAAIIGILCRQRRMSKNPEPTEAIVDRHQRHPAPGKRLAIVAGNGR